MDIELAFGNKCLLREKLHPNNCQDQVPVPPSKQTLSPNQVQKRGNHIAMQCIGHPKIVKEDSSKHKSVNKLGCNMQLIAECKPTAYPYKQFFGLGSW